MEMLPDETSSSVAEVAPVTVPNVELEASKLPLKAMSLTVEPSMMASVAVTVPAVVTKRSALPFSALTSPTAESLMVALPVVAVTSPVEESVTDTPVPLTAPMMVDLSVMATSPEDVIPLLMVEPLIVAEVTTLSAVRPP